MENLSGFPYFPAEFNREGAPVNPAAIDELVNGLGGSTDLIVISHGWNNDMEQARSLYAAFFASAAKWKDSPQLGLAGRKFSVAGVLWPSKKFTDAELIPGGAASFSDPERQEVLNALEMLKSLHDCPEQIKAIDQAKDQVDQLEDNKQVQDEWVKKILDLIDDLDEKDPDREEEGLAEMRNVKGSELLERLSAPVIFTPPAAEEEEGGAASIGSAAVGVADDEQQAAAGIGSLFSGIIGGAAKLLNFTTYYTMKERAGTVGSTGVHDMLVRIQQKYPALRVHLVGHSFGGRLVAAAAKGRAGATPLKIASMSLLQAAFSHYGFATNAAKTGKPGFFRDVLAQGILQGPGVVTHSRWDSAVGYAYAIASRVSGVNASALGDENDEYGGIGRNGAQVTPEATFGTLQKAGGTYTFTPKQLHNLDGAEAVKDSSLITNHGDVANEAVAYACLSAMR